MNESGSKGGNTCSCRPQRNHRLCPGTSWSLPHMCCRAEQISYSCSSDPKPHSRTWPASRPRCWAYSCRSAGLPAGIDQDGTGPPCRPEEQPLGSCCKRHHRCKPLPGLCRIQYHYSLKNRKMWAPQWCRNISIMAAYSNTNRSPVSCLTSSAAVCFSSVWLLQKGRMHVFPTHWQTFYGTAPLIKAHQFEQKCHSKLKCLFLGSPQ